MEYFRVLVHSISVETQRIVELTYDRLFDPHVTRQDERPHFLGVGLSSR